MKETQPEITVHGKKVYICDTCIIQDTLQLSVHHFRHMRHLLWNMDELFEVTG